MNKIITMALSALLMLSCGSKDGTTAKIDGIDIDSVTCDSVCYLEKTENSPKCHIHISMQYAKGKNTEKLNNAIIKSGLLIPEYYYVTGKDMSLKHAIDSFIVCYVNDYKNIYGKLYREDREFPKAYDFEYFVHTETRSNVKNILTYIAHIHTFGGGAHAIDQTIVKNFDIKTGHMLTLDDLFRKGYEFSLRDIIQEKMLKKFKVNDLDELIKEKSVFADRNVYPSSNFIPDDDKITFIYCSDEIAPHEIGEIRIEVDRSELEKLLKE